VAATAFAQPYANHDHLIEINPDSLRATALAVSFLEDIIAGQFERAHPKLTDNFDAYPMVTNQALDANGFLAGYDRNQLLFRKQRLAIERTFSFRLPGTALPETWVYLQAAWSAEDAARPAKRIEREQHYLLQVRDGKIVQLYSSENRHLLFYPLGLSFSGLAAKIPARE
jgi:hypothetical protein